MLSLLRSNQPIAWLLLPASALAFWFIGMQLELSPETLNDTSSWLLNALGIQVPSWLYWVVLFVNAALLNHTLGQNELQLQRNNLGGWLYLFYIFILPTASPLPAMLLAQPFVLLALNKLLSIYRQNDAGAPYFDAGFLLATASLISTVYIWLAPFFLVSLLYTRTPNWREISFLLLGMLFPPITFSALVWLLDGIFSTGDAMVSPIQLSTPYVLLILGIACFGMLGVFKVFGSFSSSSNKSRNSKAVLLINIAGLCLVAVLSGLPGQTFYYYIGLPLVLLAQAIFLSSRVYLWQQVLFVVLIATGIAFRAMV